MPMGISDENSVKEELGELPFYHGFIDSAKAVVLLRHERPGCFLLRQSVSPGHKGTFTISVIRNRTVQSTEIYHFAVLGTKRRYYAKKGLYFTKIVDLLDYYRSHDYENHLDIANIRLMHPLNKPDYDSPYSYATVEGRFDNLMAHLRQLDEETGEEICECGIAVKDAILPNGWMIHQNATKPKRIFFQHDGLNLTQWDLPDGLWSKITPNQRRFIHEHSLLKK